VSKTIVVIGFGPGISSAVADRFGAEGFSVALVARSKERLEAGVAALKSRGIASAAFSADAGGPAAIRTAITKARAELGPITVIHWNAFGGREAGDLITAEPVDTLKVFDVAIVGLLAAVQESLPDLRKTSEAAVLVTNGAFGEMTAQMDEYAVSLKSMGVALANAAKDKLVGLLAQRLKGDGIYVGQVMIAGTIKGTAWSNADSIEPSTVADKFWELYQARAEIRARIS
jgi:NADP-dependent 3-hydroxy acid dehydrogenase YdfG